MKIGNTTFTPEHFANWTKEQFIEVYKGTLHHDINEVWDAIQKAIVKTKPYQERLCESMNKKDAKTSRPGSKGKKS